MKMQASLEFMLILGGVSLLIFASILVYRGSIADNYKGILTALNYSGGNSSIMSQANATSHISSNTIGVIYTIGYMPARSTLHELSQADITFYGCPNGSLDIKISSNTLEIQQNSTVIYLRDIATYPIEFIPIYNGDNNMKLSYLGSCGGTKSSGNLTLYTYTSSSAATSNQTAAYIYANKEAEKYPISISPVYNIDEWSHCAYSNPILGIDPIQVQCGTLNAWSYMVFSDYCYWDGSSMYEYYCIIPQGTEYSIGQVEQNNISYLYNISLVVGTAYGELKSNITNELKKSQVYILNDSVGYASVEHVHGVSGEGEETVLFSPKINGSINYTLYLQYAQDKNALYNLLSYYNKTVVSYPTQSSIQQSIISYTKSLQALAETGPLPIGCALSSNNLQCSPPSQFSYDILINLSKPLGIGNVTLYTGGSSIQVKELTS